MRVAIYSRVSTCEQDPTNQLFELRRYCEARGWTIVHEFVDHGVSGAKESRPALDEMLRAAKRRRVDGVVVWKLDRLGRNLRHLILTLDELASLGVAFVSLGEGIDTATAAGRLQLHILGAIAEFERGRIAERVRIGLERARREGQRLGRPRRTAAPWRRATRFDRATGSDGVGCVEVHSGPPSERGRPSAERGTNPAGDRVENRLISIGSADFLGLGQSDGCPIRPDEDAWSRSHRASDWNVSY